MTHKIKSLNLLSDFYDNEKLSLKDGVLYADSDQKTCENLYVVIDSETGVVVPPVLSFIVSHYRNHSKTSSATQAKALRLYFDFLHQHNFSWNIGALESVDRPFTVFKWWLKEQYEEGKIAGSTARSYFSVVANFYIFHLDISTPFFSIPMEYEHIEINQFDDDVFAHIAGRSKVKCVSKEKLDVSAQSKEGSLKPFTIKEQEIFFTKLKKHGSEEFLLICSLATLSGLRASEIADLRTDMFASYKDDDLHFELELGAKVNHKSKQNSGLPVTIAGSAVKLLKSYHISSRYVNRLEKFINNGGERANVFLTQRGGAYSQHTISTLFNQFVHKYIYPEYPDFSHDFHDLRVTFGVDVMNAALNVKNLSNSDALMLTKSQMRHKRIKDTLRYLSYFQKSKALVEQSKVNEKLLGLILGEAA
ncbi:site-specific integrase [Vibrio sp. L5-1]|uniref:site-specific integrase n=1 Tax=Vibrio sp. L5-1 TaxID=2912254 RepID=UPI001F299952|nr:site-specific integrase [Vibrio sp. L5-1]MCF7495737.1 site-specific integrase [Vibrio sp. L5-1]